MRLDDTEWAVLMAVAKLGVVKGDMLAIAHEAKLSLARTMDVRDYLVRQGYLVETQRRYTLTEEGAHVLLRRLSREKKRSSGPGRERGAGRNWRRWIIFKLWC